MEAVGIGWDAVLICPFSECMPLTSAGCSDFFETEFLPAAEVDVVDRIRRVVEGRREGLLNASRVDSREDDCKTEDKDGYTKTTPSLSWLSRDVYISLLLLAQK